MPLESARHGGPWSPAVGDSDSHNDTQLVGPRHRMSFFPTSPVGMLSLWVSRVAEDAGVTLTSTARGAAGRVVRFITDEGQMARYPIGSGDEQSVT